MTGAVVDGRETGERSQPAEGSDASPLVIVIAAVAKNGVIGVDNRLPWRLPEDLARFKRLTMGNGLVMGRATFDSIGRPLPGRTTIVMTRDPAWSHDGVEVARSLDEAIALAGERGAHCYVAGGAEVYQAALAVADRLELTEVDAEPDGDTWFPSVDWSQFTEMAREPHPGFSFVTYDRRADR